MKRADFDLHVLPKLGGAPLSEEPKKKSARRKSVVVRAPVFCTRCGSYEHTADQPRAGSEREFECEVKYSPGQRFAVAVRTSNEQNGAHGHWGDKAKKRDLVRQAVGAAWKAAGIKLRPAGYRVTITRISNPLADKLNLQAFLKSVIDEVAARMGVDDSTPLVEWKLEQELGRPERPAVRIEVEELP
jgi:hypothetical protein